MNDKQAHPGLKLHPRITNPNFYILIFLTASGYCFAQSPLPNEYLQLNYDKTEHFDGITPNQLRNLKGNIHVLTQYSYDVAFKADGSTQKGELINGTSTYTLVFARNKKITEEWSYKKKEGVPSFKAYYRDFKNKKRDSSFFYQEGMVLSQSHYTYDATGFLIQESEIQKGNEAEIQILSTEKKKDTLIQKRKTYTQYFLKGHLVKTVQANHRVYLYAYYPEGTLKQKEVYALKRKESLEKFDEQGNLTYQYSANYIDTTLDYTNERILTYDAKGKLIAQKEASIEKDYTRNMHDTYYYLNDRLMSITQGEDTVATLTYTKEGDFVKRKYYYADEKFSYTYDAKGNWLERIMYIGDKPYTIDVREITYY